MTGLAISAVVPTRDRAGLLSDVLASLAAQQFSPDCWELIVVDDGSTDETPSVVERFAKSAPMRVTLVRQSNAGAGAARNVGAAIAAGQRLLFLDDDMIASKALVAEHAHHTDDPGTCVIGCIMPPSARRDPWTAWEDAQLRKLAAELADRRAAGPRDFYSGNCSVPAELFRTVGGFGFALSRGEDFQLGYRLADGGACFAFSRNAASTHLGAHGFAAWARNAEAFGKSEIALRKGYDRNAFLCEAASWYRQRNVLNRAAIRSCAIIPALRAPAVACLGAAGRVIHRLGACALANATYSAVYNIYYWRGLIESVGANEFWPAVGRGRNSERNTVGRVGCG